MSKIRVIKVRAIFPDNADDDEVADFTMDALSTMGGSRDPHDPMFYSLDVQSVEIAKTIYTKEDPYGQRK